MRTPVMRRRPARNEGARMKVVIVGGGVAWQRAEGLRAELVDAKGARAIEPELGEIRAGAYFADEAQVDPRALLRALIAATARPLAGSIETRSGTTVARLLVERDRCE